MTTMTAHDFDLLYGYFVEQGGLELIFGLDDLNSRDSVTKAWNSSNTEALLDYFSAKNYTFAALELGNEPDLDARKGLNISAAQLSADFDVLQDMLKRRQSAIPVFGPDIAFSASYLADFVRNQSVSTQGKVNAVTVHHYYGNSADFNLADFLSVKTLDSLKQTLQGLVDAKAALGDVPMYIGETSSTYGGESCYIPP
jgi:hypothetical protein